jgi:hypothetical protein
MRASLTLSVLAAAALASLVIAASASAASAPTIEAESVSHITATDATIEAQIDPGGLETTYEVWVGAYPECIEERLEPCESTGEGPAGTGAIVATIPASSSPHTISVDIAKEWHPLSPSSSYIYSVSATNSNWAYEGSAYGENKVFETAAASAPLVEGESVSQISGSDATLEAEINSEGLETTYEFHLASPPCPEQCEHLQHIFTLPSGKLLGSFVTQSVSLELNSAGASLEPGERYEYWVTATNSDGTGGSQSNAHTFTASSEEPPSIVSEGVSSITATDATLEAAIEPRAWHGAHYQFQLVSDPTEYASEILCPPTLQPGTDGCVGPQGADALPIGWVPGNLANPLSAQPVQLDLASAGITLEPSTTYHFRVIAARAVQTEDTIQWEPPTVYGADQTFTTSSDPPPLNAQTSGTDGQLPTIQSPSSTSHHRRHRHHRRHKRGLHRSNLQRASHPG